MLTFSMNILEGPFICFFYTTEKSKVILKNKKVFWERNRNRLLAYSKEYAEL